MKSKPKANLAKPVRAWAIVSAENKFEGSKFEPVALYWLRGDAKHMLGRNERIARIFVSEIRK